jgi:prolyl 4-hydroxylase
MTRTITILERGRGRPYVDGDFLDHTQPLVFTVADVLTADECRREIDRVEALGPELAPINTGRGFVEDPSIRNNERVMFDDHAFAAELYARVHDAMPDPLCHWRPAGANERFRCYRYSPGQRFAPHYDGSFRRSADEESLLTFMVYLNDDFVGGDTAFLHLGLRVAPRPGLALFFQHRLLHEGCRVDEGVKYVIRSDIMYRRPRPHEHAR